MKTRVLVPLVVLLAGCASSGCPTLAPDLQYCLRPPASGPRLATLQEMVVEKGTERETWLVRAENDDRRLAAVAVSPLGQTLASGQWDGTVVQTNAAAAQRLLDIPTLLAAVQLGAWDLAVIRSGFGDNAVHSDARPASVVFRVLHHDGRTLLELERSIGAAPVAATRLELPGRGVTVHTRTLSEPEPIPGPSP